MMLVALVLAQSMNLNNQPPTRFVCDGGITCTRSGSTLTINGAPSAGGSGAPVDGGYVTFSGGTTGSTNERTLTAGTNMTIDLATPGQVILNASGGGGAGNFISDTVTFSAGKYDATRTVTAAWATPSSKILCVADGEEASVEGLVVTVLTKSSGSFVVRAEPRNGRHTGALPFTCTGL